MAVSLLAGSVFVFGNKLVALSTITEEPGLEMEWHLEKVEAGAEEIGPEAKGEEDTVGISID